MYEPIHIPEHTIYDIFHNGEKCIIVTRSTEPKRILLKHSDGDTEFKYIVLDIFGGIYVCKCTYSGNITISINDVIIKTHVNTYPKFDNQIVLSTLVKNEDKYIIQWIKYYTILGVTGFVIYDNSNNNTLSTILSDYIRNNTVVLIHWPYQYYEPSGVASGQVCHINHAIYNLKTSKYVGFFDVDEYLNPQISNYKLESVFDRVLTHYNLNYDEIGSFRSLSKFFINNQSQNEDGFEFMKVGNCQDILLEGYEKHFVVPKNIDAFCVHSIIKGKPDVTLPTNIMFHNHYYFLNKPHRGRTGYQITHTDNSIIRLYHKLTLSEKKIRIKLNGRLGNQLFQIAFSEYLKQHFNVDVSIEIAHLQPDELAYLSTILKPWSHLIDSTPSYELSEHKLHPRDWIQVINDISSPVVIHGYFQNHNYVPKNFSHQVVFSDTVLNKYPEIESSVFIHIRGTDYRLYDTYNIDLN